MNENTLTLLHELLGRVTQANNTQELENIANEYADRLCVCDNKLIEAVWSDIKVIGGELVALRSKENSNDRNKRLSTLT